ncbi:penicillin-binding protein [Nocardioides marmoriginsengisoli]|uniref:Beta-lactamase n=1 Tax=Nocardioides marmoriginsengisoli TaxID=661483 RepID=A0A3N0CB65_9ACTN|nr:penicillin-binding transpeptidase domain-containing protein [Nocardioides marmoriginsengisoli]RNL60690.1 penicillin-binding protein [Nocardioides marmoriginsengisoli]
MTSRRRFRLLLPLLIVVALFASACGPFGGDDDGAKKAAEELAEALAGGDVAKIPFTEDNAAARFTTLTKPLKSFASEVTVTGVEQDGDKATATLAWKSDRDGAVWDRETEADLVKSGETWKTVWKPSIVESSLVDAEELVVTGIKPERGNIIGRDGKALVEPRPVVRFGIDKTLVPGAAAAASAASLAAVLDVSAADFVKEVKAAGPKAFVEAIVLRRADVSSSLIGRVEAVKGGRSISDHLPLAPTKDFAAALLGTVGPATAEIIKDSKGRLRAGDDAGLSGLQARYDEQLGGVPGVKVSAKHVVEEASDLNEDATPRVLFSAEPTKGTDLDLTLDLRLQGKAQDLLERYGPASALVAIKPSTGEILAAASGPGSKGYNTATFGQYAPGSTFKVVSSLALLRSGLKPSSPVQCPATISVNGKQFKNYSDYPSGKLGRITLRDAVANSCNTAFISSRSRIKGTALADAAAALGFGVDHDLGFPAYFGQVPAPQGETEAAADLIGQGKILASPMAMAAVVASVVKGATVVPALVGGLERPAADPAKPLTKAEAASLRELMRAVVTSGSGSFLGSLAGPPVIAKTGTAEYGTKTPLLTHAWMVGAQGDLAVAVFVDTGQSGSRTAGPVLDAFLRAAR